jgi:hypothetical protein
MRDPRPAMWKQAEGDLGTLGWGAKCPKDLAMQDAVCRQDASWAIGLQEARPLVE